MHRDAIPIGLVALFLAAPVAAVKLWATSYNDHALTTLDFSEDSLSVVGKSLDCGSEPTWMTLDKAKSLLYCLNEGWGGAASLTSYKVNADATLETLDVLSVLKSPVASSLYGPDNSGLAIAHYDTSTFSSFDVKDPSNLGLAQNVTYTLDGPGPVPDRQDAPHLHHTIVDPRGEFIVVPDLGADLLRVYKLAADSIAWTELPPQKAPAGSGPRHGVFVKAATGDETYFYVFNELSNTITGFTVSYADGGLTLTEKESVPSGGPGTTVPADTKAAELLVSPDNKFIIASTRFDSSLTIPNFDRTNCTALPSDPLNTFKVEADGALTHVQTAPAGGVNPRGININKAGTLIASALQDDNRVVIIKRDVETGKLGDFVSWATVGEGDGNGPNYVLFDE